MCHLESNVPIRKQLGLRLERFKGKAGGPILVEKVSYKVLSYSAISHPSWGYPVRGCIGRSYLEFFGVDQGTWWVPFSL